MFKQQQKNNIVNNIEMLLKPTSQRCWNNISMLFGMLFQVGLSTSGENDVGVQKVSFGGKKAREYVLTGSFATQALDITFVNETGFVSLPHVV